MENKALLERSLVSVWHPCTQMKLHETLPLIPIKSASGVWLYDFDGHRYLDAISSWWVNLFGHANPKINAALTEQLQSLEHVLLAGFTHEPVVKLSERLAGLAPQGLGHCFYGSDGASAVEIALKMSFHYWVNSSQPQKNRFITLENSYHGETLGALSVTDVALFKDVYAPLIRHSHQVQTPDWRNAEAGESAEQYAVRAAQSLETYLQQHHAEIAAFVIEPLVQAATGMAMYHPSYLRIARQLCDRYEVHLIADEIAVGFGRSGTLFACEQAPIRPDFLCLSKGLTGGYLPLAVVLTTDQVYAAFYDGRVSRGFLHSHSYSGNALACRAALATLDIFETERVIERNRLKADLLNQLAGPLAEHKSVRHLRNTGMIWAFDAAFPEAGFGNGFYRRALQRGLLLRPIGNTVYFMPPYIIDQDEMSLLVRQTLEILDELPK